MSLLSRSFSPGPCPRAAPPGGWPRTPGCWSWPSRSCCRWRGWCSPPSTRTPVCG
ncbi:hypothetical protein ACFQV4_32575 [Streptomyces thermocarboxydus]